MPDYAIADIVFFPAAAFAATITATAMIAAALLLSPLCFDADC